MLIIGILLIFEKSEILTFFEKFQFRYNSKHETSPFQKIKAINS